MTKVLVTVKINDLDEIQFEGEEKDVYLQQILWHLKAPVPQLQLKFGDSGATVQVNLKKVE